MRKRNHKIEIGGIMLPARVIFWGILIFGLSGPVAAAAVEDAMKLYQQGVAANKKGDTDEAIRSYSKAIILKPDSAALFFVRGRAYREKHQYDNAVSDLSRAIALNPRYAEAYNQRGVTYIGKGEKQKAMADFKKSCELGSKDGCANVRILKGMP
jgi:tetratricopeptide (TPR) repeat protein